MDLNTYIALGINLGNEDELSEHILNICADRDFCVEEIIDELADPCPDVSDYPPGEWYTEYKKHRDKWPTIIRYGYSEYPSYFLAIDYKVSEDWQPLEDLRIPIAEGEKFENFHKVCDYMEIENRTLKVMVFSYLSL